MGILDRYIARHFLVNIAVLMLVLGSFVVMVDLSVNLQRYLGLAEQYSRESGQEATGLRRALMAVLLVADLWWPRLLQLFNYLLGLVLIGAMGFTFAHMVRHRELVAAMAGGVSLYRLMVPVLAVTLLMVGVQIANQELVMPRIAPLLARNNTQIRDRDLGAFPVRLVPDGQGRLFMAAKFDPASGVMEDVNIWERDATGRATARIHADRGEYKDGAWVLASGLRRPLALAASPTDGSAQNARPVGRVESDLTPTALVAVRYRSFAQSLSWSQLSGLLSSPTLKADLRENLERIAWGRVSNILCVLLAIIIAMPFFLTREPGNIVVQSMKCAPLAIGSVLGSVLGTAAAIPGIPVHIAVFLPVLALAPLAIAMGTSIKT